VAGSLASTPYQIISVRQLADHGAWLSCYSRNILTYLLTLGITTSSTCSVCVFIAKLTDEFTIGEKNCK